MATSASGKSPLQNLGAGGKAAVGAVFPILLAVVYWTVFYGDIAAKIDGESSLAKRLKAELAQSLQAQASYFADRDELALRQQRQRELNKILPPDNEEASFLSSIQQVSNVSGMTLNAWRPMDEIKEAYFARVPMQLEMSGRFHQFARFGNEVGKLDRIINLENIQMVEDRKGTEEPNLKVKCLATAFHTVGNDTKEKR